MSEAAETDVADVKAERRTYLGKTALHWLLDFAFIVVSVMLAFAIAQYGTTRAEQQLAARVLSGLDEEIMHNIALLEPALAKHQQWAAAMTRWVRTYSAEGAPRPAEPDARSVFLGAWPGVNVDALNIDALEVPFPTLNRAAWDTAISTGALRLIDYDVTAALSEIYAWQDALPVVPADDVAFFDPAQQMPATMRTVFAMDALVISENTLLNLYKKHLPAVRAAAENAD